MDTLVPDSRCLIGRTMAEMEAVAPVPMVPPAHWFEPPTESQMAALNDTVIDGRVMAAIGVCEPDVGRFTSLVAEDGVPFTFPYPSVLAPMLDGNNHDLINNRAENALAVADTDGGQRNILAGKGRFGHSPQTMDTMDELLEFHDADEGAFLRFRFHDVEQDGKTLLVATGAVLPSIMENGKPRPTTWADLDQLRNAEVSPEFLDINGRLYYVALSLVSAGNTNTSLAEKLAASIRPIKGKAEPMPETITTTTVTGAPPEPETAASVLEELVAKAEHDRLIAERDAIAAERDELAADRQTLIDLADVDLDLSPLTAAIDTSDELLEAIGEAVAEQWGAASDWEWAEGFELDSNVCYYTVEFDDRVQSYRQEFTVDEDAVELVGEPEPVRRDCQWVPDNQ